MLSLIMLFLLCSLLWGGGIPGLLRLGHLDVRRLSSGVSKLENSRPAQRRHVACLGSSASNLYTLAVSAFYLYLPKTGVKILSSEYNNYFILYLTRRGVKILSSEYKKNVCPSS